MYNSCPAVGFKPYDSLKRADMSEADVKARANEFLPKIMDKLWEYQEHLEIELFTEQVEADWVKIMGPIINFLLSATPDLLLALAETLNIEGYANQVRKVDPDDPMFTEPRAALARFKGSWNWMGQAHVRESVVRKLSALNELLGQLDGTTSEAD